MRFVHLSDLHLGKRVNEFPMIEDQRYILEEIISIIDEQKPDGILIAGDIYDRTIPSEEAMQLWDEFLGKLSKRQIPVYAINGNHDSAVRFSDHNKLVESAGIYLSPLYNGNVEPIVLEDNIGKLNIYMLPFVKPINVRQFFPDEKIESYTDACRAAIKAMDIDQNERNILIAHQFVTGAETCDSEEHAVGGLDNVDVNVFEKFDYVALGHIHGRQSIGRDTVRYSGTPLKYSFSEKNHKKTITIVDIGAKDDIRINEIALHPMHDLREIRGNYDELTSKANYEGTAVDDYLHIILTDEDDILDAISKLRIIYPNIMKLSYDNKRTRENREITDVKDIEIKSPIELFEEFYEMRNNQKLSEEQRTFTLEIIKSIWEDN